MSSEKLGDKIYDLRMSNKLSQDELADKIKVSRQTISKWEANAYQPKSNMLRRLCDAFDVDSNYFMPKKDTTAETTDLENPESEVVCDEVASDETNKVNLDKVEDVEIQQESKSNKLRLSNKTKIVITSVVLAFVAFIGLLMIMMPLFSKIPDIVNAEIVYEAKSTVWNFSVDNIGWMIFCISISVALIIGIVLLCKILINRKNLREKLAESHIN
ncbi:MAG: helix-turn-helix domain-containing protein [Clostridia bacterium]|nr:helix-turn-helix domain-containing protein [Clostridia bacterium]